MMSLRSRIHLLVAEARLACGQPNSAADVENHILSRFWGRVVGDDDMHRLLVARGINAEVRQVLARHGDGEEGAQAAGGRAAVFVPSRKEYVALEPQ